MGNKEFGKFVEALRKQQRYFDDKDNERQWTRQVLAQKAGLSERQIISIEQGTVAKLKPLLEGLAQAFDLTEIETKHFYAKAGFVYPTHQAAESRDFLSDLLRNFHHPVSVRNSVWDFVAFNEYHRLLWGYTAETLTLLDDNSKLGANLLRVWFDPGFDSQLGTRDMRTRKEVVWAFRASSFPYVETGRYRTIVREMHKYRGFKKAWDEAGELPSYAERGTVRRPLMKINHPEFGEMEFMILAIPERYFTEDIHMTLHVPTTASEERYQRLRESVRQNRVHRFKEHPLQ